MSVPRQARVVIMCDFMAVILVLGVMFKSKAPEDRVSITTPLQCKTLPVARVSAVRKARKLRTSKRSRTL